MKASTFAYVFLAGLAVVGCQNGKLTIGKEPTTAKVARQDLIGYTFFEGKVITPPGAQATVLAPYDVALSEVPVTQGKWVGRGATIATMQIPDLKASVDQAEINLKAAQSAYAAARAQYEAPVREAERVLADARAAERQARSDVQMGGSSDVVAAEEARKMAEAGVASAKATMNSQLLAEKQSVDIAAEYLKDARAGAKIANIRAPISGNVVRLEAKPGLVVKAKQELATLVDLGAIDIQGTFAPEQKDLVKVGTEVMIVVDGTDSEPLHGKVREVSVIPPADGQESQGYLAMIEFDNEKGLVMPGSTIKRLGVRTGRVEDALVVPVGAVEVKDGKSYVQIQQGSEWVQTLVETGLTDGALIEIKTGLKEGDVVKVMG